MPSYMESDNGNKSRTDENFFNPSEIAKLEEEERLLEAMYNSRKEYLAEEQVGGPSSGPAEAEPQVGGPSEQYQYIDESSLQVPNNNSVYDVALSINLVQQDLVNLILNGDWVDYSVLINEIYNSLGYINEMLDYNNYSLPPDTLW